MTGLPPDIHGTIVEDTTIAARAGWSRVIKKGEMMRIIDLHGKQAVDFLCWNAHDHEDRYAAADTMKINETGIFLTTGTTFYSVGLTPLMTITADTCAPMSPVSSPGPPAVTALCSMMVKGQTS